MPLAYQSTAEVERLTAIADKTNPGGSTAWDGYINPFLSRGKLITYVGEPCLSVGIVLRRAHRPTRPQVWPTISFPLALLSGEVFLPPCNLEPQLTCFNRYYEHVRESLGYPKNLGDSYRLFTIPGMHHCGFGNAAWNCESGPDLSQNL